MGFCIAECWLHTRYRFCGREIKVISLIQVYPKRHLRVKLQSESEPGLGHYLAIGADSGRQSDSDESLPVLSLQVCIPSSAVLRVGHGNCDSHCGWKVGAQVACASPRESSLGSGTKKRRA